MIKILITDLNAIKYFQIIMLHLFQEKKWRNVICTMTK